MSILHNYVEMAAMVVFGIGFTTLLLHRNMIKKIIGFSIMDNAIFLFLAAKGYIEGRRAPIIENGVMDMEAYINPIPAGLVLTGIVVSVSVTAVMLALTVRLYRRYHTLDIDEITAMCRAEDEPGVIEIATAAPAPAEAAAETPVEVAVEVAVDVAADAAVEVHADVADGKEGAC